MKKDTNIENTLGVDSNFTSYDSDGNLNKGVEILPLDIIVPNPNQPRKSFDQTALEELAVSIKNYGIIQPIIVCPVGDGKYQIVAGERRYRASKIAGMNNIPVLKMILTAKQIKELSLIENLQRQDLNPIEEAKAFRSLIEEYGFTQEQLADRLGKSRPAITNSLRLLSLNPVVIDMVVSGRLSAGHARCLTSIKDFIVQNTYALAACDKQLSVRQLELMVRNYLNPSKKDKKIMDISVELKDMVNIMQKKFGTKVGAVGNNTKGRIFIDYYSTADLDRIFEILEQIKD
ncbi:MAG: ParB/RepB/Spo0J family partition protein [Clostridia bacterium]|jgi:ParB family chromosome partitioning protein|nr:ParB/RepB/Spo0J family partition protein [Clostridia bacterium]MCI8944670.1 ParB/RepB/Spo0J family partition protein [Clostridia bacterium]MCI9290915.1 ParB/RepB/Spo0J family partition protein [Clostridia bacterium]MDE6884916.1 ParB/RepB/Spo0J family partition protein [Clostridia bacterium]